MIQFSAQVLGVQSKVDRTLNLKLNTQELPGEDAGTLYNLSGQQVWVGISETAITGLDVPKEVQEFDSEKSPSERLRNVLYVYWDTKTDKTKSFDDFRKGYMEKIINGIKEKLD